MIYLGNFTRDNTPKNLLDVINPTDVYGLIIKPIWDNTDQFKLIKEATQINSFGFELFISFCKNGWKKVQILDSEENKELLLPFIQDNLEELKALKIKYGAINDKKNKTSSK